MKRNILYILFLGFVFAQCSQKVTAPVMQDTQTKEAFRSSAPAPGAARKINLGTPHSFKLPNGLHVIVSENNKLPVVSYAISLKNEGFREGDAAGTVSIAGALLGTGTINRSKAEIDVAVDFIGATLNTSGSGMFGRSLTKHQGAMLDLMTDVLYNPTFPAEEFEKLKTQTLTGLSQTKSDPNAMAANVASVLRYGADHPYGEVQTEETVKNITVEKCKEHYKKWFQPSNAYLTIVGDISPAEAEAQAKKYFGKWKNNPVVPEVFETVEGPSERKVAFVPKDGAVQSVIQITYPIDLKPGSPDAIKARVMNSILGGGIFSGRLMQNLREDKAFTYGARSSISNDAVVGNFNAGASVRNEVTDSSIVEFLFEMNRMRNQLVSAGDLSLTKSSLSGSFARSLESPQTVARFARNIVRYNLPADYYETYLEKLDAVTIQDVNEMAKKYIRPDNAYIIVVGDRDNVAPTLEKFDSNGKIDFYDPFGKELKDSDVVVPEGVSAKTVLMDYIQAIGGNEKVSSVKSMETVMGMDLMGQSIEIKVLQKMPGKFYMRVGNDQMVFSEQKTDGMKAMVGGAGQPPQVFTEGKEFEDIKGQATIFSQLDYISGDYTLELKGVEEVDGENCYKVQITEKDGKNTYEYYSMKTSLLLRQVTNQDGPGGQAITITNDFKEYGVIDGIQFPNVMTVTGMMPTPVDMKLKSVKVNPELADDIFTVE